MNSAEYIIKLIKDKGGVVKINRPQDVYVIGIGPSHIFRYNDYNFDFGGFNFEAEHWSGCHSRTLKFKYEINVRNAILIKSLDGRIERYIREGESVDAEVEEEIYDYDWNDKALEKKFSNTLIKLIKKIEEKI